MPVKTRNPPFCFCCCELLKYGHLNEHSTFTSAFKKEIRGNEDGCLYIWMVVAPLFQMVTSSHWNCEFLSLHWSSKQMLVSYVWNSGTYNCFHYSLVLQNCWSVFCKDAVLISNSVLQMLLRNDFILKTMIVTALPRKFPTFYGTQGFFTMFIRAH